VEPTQVPLTTRYTIYTYVDETFTHEGQHYAHFRGSRESIALGTEPLSLQAGDRVKITFEKVQA
jgi:hypothetical protein